MQVPGVNSPANRHVCNCSAREDMNAPHHWATDPVVRGRQSQSLKYNVRQELR